MKMKLKTVACDDCGKTLTWKTLNLHGDQFGGWEILCNDCPGPVYHITGIRINSYAKALTWTIHLSRKTWFNTSEWEDVLNRMFVIPGA